MDDDYEEFFTNGPPLLYCEIIQQLLSEAGLQSSVIYQLGCVALLKIWVTCGGSMIVKINNSNGVITIAGPSGKPSDQRNLLVCDSDPANFTRIIEIISETLRSYNEAGDPEYMAGFHITQKEAKL